MNGLGDLFKEYWGAMMALIGGVVWLVRLESRSVSNERDIKRLEVQRKEDRDEMNVVLKEMRDDIKKLLQRSAD